MPTKTETNTEQARSSAAHCSPLDLDTQENAREILALLKKDEPVFAAYRKKMQLEAAAPALLAAAKGMLRFTYLAHETCGAYEKLEAAVSLAENV